jgi:hypothetical protein
MVVWSRALCSNAPLALFHIFSMPDAPDVARRLPSGDQPMARSGPVAIEA